MNAKKPQAFSRCGNRASKLFGFKIATAVPVRTTLVQVFTSVESEMLFPLEEQHACG
jgi:hypothetical protein